MASYDRYWDLHVTGKSGYYDFADSIQEQGNYQTQRHSEQLPTFRMAGGGSLPEQGCVASIVRVDELETLKSSEQFAQLTAWVSSARDGGKLRVNAHCDGNGRLGMTESADRTRPLSWTNARKLVDWLWTNGLEEPGKLKTIALAVCMGARNGTRPARHQSGWLLRGPTLSSAPGSAVHQVLRALRARQLTGIEVTGSNEVTIMGAKQPGQLARVLGLGANQIPMGTSMAAADVWDIDYDREGRTVIMVPRGWRVRADSVDIPTQFRMLPSDDNLDQSPSGGWVLKMTDQEVFVPLGWIVDTRARSIILPLGWVGASRGPQLRGTITSPRKNDVGAFGERLAHSPDKVRERS
jgi:hypothetical protein